MNPGMGQRGGCECETRLQACPGNSSIHETGLGRSTAEWIYGHLPERFMHTLLEKCASSSNRQQWGGKSAIEARERETPLRVFRHDRDAVEDRNCDQQQHA